VFKNSTLARFANLPEGGVTFVMNIVLRGFYQNPMKWNGAAGHGILEVSRTDRADQPYRFSMGMYFDGYTGPT
jgi:hypothetical protein